tara:strand:- start:14798 stop:15856 length:1059 start_codon:yes stop_codon:yes gene_type:complete
MSINYLDHLINKNDSIKYALKKLNKLAADAILFLVDDNNKLIGSITDGDLRRGFINGKTFNDKLIDFIQKKPKKIKQNNYQIRDLINYRNQNFTILPLVDDSNIVIDILNFKILKSFLPVHAFIVAGGKGVRLYPLTKDMPKPLLKVGNKPIIEHNIDSLVKFGIKNINISINYLGHKIQNYFNDGSRKGISIKYIKEKIPLGTIGSITKINSLINEDDILLLNSDLLTTINYEKLYLFYKENNADLVVACTPYKVNVPLGVIESDNNIIKSLKEKPTYTYYSNAGIYLFKKSIIDYIPKDTFFNATDLINKLISLNKKVMKYQMIEYWTDIGRKEDLEKAKVDIINLEYFQ